MTEQTDVEENLPNGREANCCASEMQSGISSWHLDRRKRLLRLPRQPVARGTNGQVGVESSGVCGPARVEAVDWHSAHATQGAWRCFVLWGGPRPSAGRQGGHNTHLRCTTSGLWMIFLFISAINEWICILLSMVSTYMVIYRDHYMSTAECCVHSSCIVPVIMVKVLSALQEEALC